MSHDLDTTSAARAQAVHYTPSIFSANWLYLLSMLLILSVGALLQSASFSWGLLGTELLLILLPTLAVLRLQRLPLKKTLRLQWPGWSLMGLALAAGIGLWLVGAALEALMTLLFGYALPATADTYPVTIGQAILVFAALALAAPLCEEMMFRGAIQGAYEGRGAGQALIITSLLFAFFHFRLQGLFALLPVAFTLGFLRWRSHSLWPAVAAHFGNNALGAILLAVAGLQTDWLENVPLGSPQSAGVGLLVTLLALWLFARITQRQKAVTAVPEPDQAAHFSWKTALPLAIAALLYVVVGGFEFVYGRMPERIITEPLTLGALEIEQKTEWVYDIRNVLDESVGQATCNLTPVAADYVLQCQADIQAFKVELPGSLYQSDDYSAELTVQWRGNDLNPVAGERQTVGNDSTSFWRLEPAASGLNLVTDEAGTTQTVALPESVLLPDEWPWRFMALPFDDGLGQRANYVWPSLWQPETESGVPAVEEVAVVFSGAEPVTTPAGDFIAWRVKMGSWTAWYDVNAPHTLLRYEFGSAAYVLTAVRHEPVTGVNMNVPTPP